LQRRSVNIIFHEHLEFLLKNIKFEIKIERVFSLCLEFGRVVAQEEAWGNCILGPGKADLPEYYCHLMLHRPDLGSAV